MKSEWTPLATDFFSHPDVRRAGRDGALLFLAALCHCQHHLTDGYVDAEVLPVLAVQAWTKPQAAEACVRAGLFREVRHGFIIPGWSEWNEAAAKVEARKRADRERKRRGTAADSARNSGGSSEEFQTSPTTTTTPSDIENYSANGTSAEEPVDNQANIAVVRAIREAL